VLRVGFAGVAVLALALLPKACAKKPPPDPPIDAPLPPPIPVTSATTPPIWSPPTGPTTTATTTSTAAPPPPSAELLKARVAADARDFKKVKAILDKKVRGGKCAPEESQLLFRACVQLKDKACADAVKAKHPDDVASE
jgi:hypothetical protein